MLRKRILALAAAALVTAPPPSSGKPIMARHRPEVTEAGSFEGTWYHVSAALRLGLWIRKAEEGGYQVRIDWRARDGLQFTTDWEGAGRYSMRGFPGHVTLEVDPAATTGNLIAGTYERVLELEDGDYHREGGPFRIQRTRDGNGLMWSFDPYTQEKKVAGEVESASSDDIFFELAKASFRLVEFDDIPW